MNGVYEPRQDPVQVLLADDAAVIRQAVGRLLEAEPSIKLLGTAENMSQTLQMAVTLRPDVLLLDLHMPDTDVFEPLFVRSQLEISGARVLGMSLSNSKNDKALRMLAESYGVITLLDKAEFGRVLIPAILDSESKN